MTHGWVRQAKHGLLATLLLAGLVAQANVWAKVALHTNQFGYHPQGPKESWISGANHPDGFSLRPVLVDPVAKGKLVFWKPRVVLTPAILEEQPDLIKLDWSALATSGLYSARLGSLAPDPALEKRFRVSEFVYWDLFSTGLRALVLQRSGVTIQDPVTAISLLAGHEGPVDPAPALKGQSARLVPGGWYDGIGYDRLTTDMAWTTARLFQLYQLDAPVFGTLKLNYPPMSVSPGSVEWPDLLKEAGWGLQWLLAMQAADGSFYSGITADTPLQEVVLPHRDQRHFSYQPATVTSTAQGTAVLAQASRTLRPLAVGQAIQTLVQAEKGWLWLTHYQGTLSPAQRIQMGWAGVLLYQATGQAGYLAQVESFWQPLTVSDWQQAIVDQPDLLTVLATLFIPEKPGASANAQLPRLPLDSLKTLLTSESQRLMALQQTHPYHLAQAGATIAGNDGVVRDALWLALASLVDNRGPQARAGASRQVDYLLGFNPWDQPFVTGDPEVSKVATLDHPCHPFSKAAREVLPGLLVVGPAGGYPQDVPFQDNAYDCQVTSAPTGLNSRFIWLMGLMNHLYKPQPAQSTTAKTDKGVLTAPSARQQKLPPIE